MVKDESLISGNLFQQKRQKYLLGLFALLFFLLVYVLNVINPLWGDDFRYSYVDMEDFQPIRGFYDIFISQYKHYMEWGGRSVVHVIAQFLLMIDIRLSHLLNSLAYILFVYLIYKLVNKGKKTNATVFLFVNLLVFVAQYPFYGTVIWITGSANYLWGTTIIIAFIYPYYSYYTDNKTTDNVLKSIGFFLFGIIAGWTNENTSVAMIFTVIVICIYFKLNKIKLPYWCIFGIIGACVGCFMMIKAPGNYVRYDIIIESLELQGKPLGMLLHKIPRLVFRYVTSLFLLTLAYWVLYRFCFRKNELKGVKNRQLLFSILMLISAHVGFLAMIAAPTFPPRATFGIVTFMVIAVGILFVNTDIKLSNLKVVNKRSVMIFLGLLFVFFYCQRLYHISYLSAAVKHREQFIKEQKEKGIYDIEFATPIIMPKEYNFDDLSEDTIALRNKTFSHYYKINTVWVLYPDEKR